MTISYKDRVAIVTGAGGGLGRAYALELAARGAKVVVNDLGGSRDGTGHSDAALKVVEEIKAAGGQAMSNGGSVTEFEQMVEMVAKTKEAWGGVHILINNAGILRDKSFAKMTMEDFRLVVDVHLNGSANCTKAVWDLMREQAYGRILMTASSTGLFGNFGQANYGAAKLGLAGFTKTLALELATHNITANCISPGYVWTALIENQIPDTMKTRGLSRDAVINDVLLAKQPTKKGGKTAARKVLAAAAPLSPTALAEAEARAAEAEAELLAMLELEGPEAGVDGESISAKGMAKGKAKGKASKR